MAGLLSPLLGFVLAALPFVALLAIFEILRLHGEEWRSAAIGAATCWGVLVALITEILSLPRLLTRPVVALVWFLLATVLVVYILSLRRRPLCADQSRVEPGTQNSDGASLSGQEWSLLSGVGLLIALVGVTAVISAPNVWDAMAYHMSRIALWMTNRDINLYPAFYSAQLFLSPWSEYAMLHLDLLYGGDRLVNLIEWMSMIGTSIGVSLIAQKLGAGRLGQVFATVAWATIPNGLLEASGAMNTLVGAFWIVAATYYLLRWDSEQSWPVTLALGSALGLAVSTKGTAYIFLPCVMLLCWWMGPPHAKKLFLQRLPVLLLIFLVLNGPLYVRNYRLSRSPLGFSTPLGDDPLRQYANSRHSLSITTANLVKNLELHFGTVGPLNREITQITFAAFHKLGIDPNDPESTYRGGFHMNGLSTNEVRAGDPVHLLLIVLAGLLLFSRRIGDRSLRLYMMGLIMSFTLFCALLRWQHANGRYHLPLFALGLALVGVVLERTVPRAVVVAVAWLLLLPAIPLALLNSLRPLVPVKGLSILTTPRVSTYFADSHSYLEDSYVSAANAVRAMPCNSVGVDASLEDFDYPIFALLHAGHSEKQVRYAGVNNLTAAFARPHTSPPCALICLRCATAPAQWAQYRPIGGKVSLFGEVAVFSPEGNLPNTEVFALPGPYEPDRILARLDHYRDSPPGTDLPSTEEGVHRAIHDWPSKRADLRARLDELYTAGISLWRVRDSVDPMRRKGEPIDHSKIDPVQLMAALQVTESWFHSYPEKVSTLNGQMDQLYSSWETRLTGTPALDGDTTSVACRMEVETVENRTDHPNSMATTTAGQKRVIQTSDCSCLGTKAHPGALLARKSFGLYDAEAEIFVDCPGKADSPGERIFALGPVRATQAAVK
jgi:hypothetical protein